MRSKFINILLINFAIDPTNIVGELLDKVLLIAKIAVLNSRDTIFVVDAILSIIFSKVKLVPGLAENLPVFSTAVITL